MGRSILAVLVLILCLSATPGKWSYGYGSAEIENVILIVVDTLAAQHLGFMGYERDTSPFIDKLASQSVIFNRLYTPEAKTVPSFTTLLSGCHPSSHGVIENGVNLPADLHFLTDNFRDAGFTTWGIPSARVIGMQYGLDKGFDYYSNTPALSWPGDVVNERIERILTGTPRFMEPDFTQTTEPIFLMIHYFDPHVDFTPDTDILAMFANPDYDGPVDGTGVQFQDYNDYLIDFDEEDTQYVRDLYDAEIRTFDNHLRDLFNLLDSAGLLENSLIVFTADHGENLGEHHFIAHGHPYEKALHIPLFFLFPDGQWAGTRIDTLVQNTDTVPTIMDLMGVEIPDGIDGRSLLPLMGSESDGEYIEREKLFAIGYQTDTGRTYGLFDGTHRLIVEFGKWGDVGSDSEIQLYDITVDPEEKRNLYEQEREVLKDMAPLLGHMVVASHEGHSHEMDNQTLEMLASLGYL